MIDFARIVVIAGKGGNGAGSFTHIKGKRRGKADGGDGGRGGHIYFEATGDLNTLEPFRFVKEYRAKNGVNGASRKRKGAEGEDLVIKVPAGTVIKVISEPSSRAQVEGKGIGESYDLVGQGEQILVASGGAGGRGNSHLRDEFGRRPFKGEKGKEGETVNLELELKLIADVGLIGFPNAGKSTLLRALTAASPKIAAYPFTTLEPNLGVIKLRISGNGSGFRDNKKKPDYTLYPHHYSLTIADIPGLIEGASRGKGLGDLFLRHIERTKILVHLIDISTSGDFWKDYQIIRGELKNYSKELAKKKEIIVLNKIDMVEKAAVDKALLRFKSKRKKAVAVSAAKGENLNNLVNLISKTLLT